MKPDYPSRITNLVLSDAVMCHVLKHVRALRLQDCWIGAGFIRNKVWDTLHQLPRSALNDIDVIYFDPHNVSKSSELALEVQLHQQVPTFKWSVKNQARMHIRNGHAPYTNCEHAISFWPETATAVAVRLNELNQLEYIAPYGLEDLFTLNVRPTPNINSIIYEERIKAKKWEQYWPLLKIQMP